MRFEFIVGLAAAALLLTGCGTGKKEVANTGLDQMATGDLATGDTTSHSDVVLDSGGEDTTALPDLAADLPLPPPDTESDVPQPKDTPIVPDVVDWCQVLDPLQPFMFGLGIPEGEAPGNAELSGSGIVTYVYVYGGGFNWDWEIHIALVGVEQAVTVNMTLPHQYRIPVEVGEEVYVHAKLTMPWWENKYLAIWDSDKHLRFLLYSGDGSGQAMNCEAGPCPSVNLLPTECEPVPAECGESVYPEVRFTGSWGAEEFDVARGETQVEQAAEGTFKFIVAEARSSTTMECDDYPNNWISAIFMDNFDVSQCWCQDHFDCAFGQLCETEANKCVQNKCLNLDCEGGYFCDPYKGLCFPPPPGVMYACDTSADCPDQDEPCGMICNTGLGFCQSTSCCVMDCLGYCSDLLGGCHECLTDCNCEPFGLCDENSTCQTCNPDKIAMTQENPKMYEFYELCIPADFDAAVPILQEIDPSLYCGMAGVFAKCDADEVGCHGDLDYLEGTKTISDSKWTLLCHFSMMDHVSKIAGGHFL